MTSTRRAKDGVFHQGRYTSSPEFRAGLSSLPVAKRCAVLQNAEDRELVWWLQWVSNQDGGLAAFAENLVHKFAEALGTSAMVEIGKKSGEHYTADEVRKICFQLPVVYRVGFSVCGETDRDLAYQLRQIEDALRLAEIDDSVRIEERENLKRQAAECKRRIVAVAEKSANQPGTYPVAEFLQICRNEALGKNHSGCSALENELLHFCTNPVSSFSSGPWYFSDLVNVLRVCRNQWIRELPSVVETSITRKIDSALNYTLAQRAEGGFLSLIMGGPSLGVRFASRAWCERQAGCARLVDCPPSNDEASFFRAIARGLGLGNFLNYKNGQVRERVELVLQTGEVMLVIGSAQNLWPQKNLREAFPGRLAWVLDQVAKGAAIAMISNPQFFMQKKACEKVGWDSPALRDRINHFELLPGELSVAELTAIASAMFPEAGKEAAELIAIFGLAMQGYISTLESVGKRASYISHQVGRSERTVEDFQKALKDESLSSKALRDTIAGQSTGTVKKSAVQPGATLRAQSLPQSQAAASCSRFNHLTEDQVHA